MHAAGVIQAKFVFDALLKDQSIKFESIAGGKNATASLSFSEYTAEQLKQVNEVTDWIYDALIDRVGVLSC